MMNNMEYNPDGMEYMEQEEEWEREGLLDPAWEKQQKKVCLYPKLHLSLYYSCHLCHILSTKESEIIFNRELVCSTKKR